MFGEQGGTFLIHTLVWKTYSAGYFKSSYCSDHIFALFLTSLLSLNWLSEHVPFLLLLFLWLVCWTTLKTSDVPMWGRLLPEVALHVDTILQLEWCNAAFSCLSFFLSFFFPPTDHSSVCNNHSVSMCFSRARLVVASRVSQGDGGGVCSASLFMKVVCLGYCS